MYMGNNMENIKERLKKMVKILDNNNNNLENTTLTYELRTDENDIIMKMGYCDMSDFQLMFKRCEELHLNMFHSETGTFIIF